MSDPADDVALADTVGIALQAVIDRLSPRERVAFVLHDSFGFEFATIAAVLDTTPVGGTQARLAGPGQGRAAGAPRTRWPTGRSSTRSWRPPAAATSSGCSSCSRPTRWSARTRPRSWPARPPRIEGRDEVATFFNGSAQAALAVFVGDRPASAWFHRGEAAVVFDFEVADGQVRAITFRAEPAVLERVVRREGPESDEQPPRSHPRRARTSVE